MVLLVGGSGSRSRSKLLRPKDVGQHLVLGSRHETAVYGTAIYQGKRELVNLAGADCLGDVTERAVRVHQTAVDVMADVVRDTSSGTQLP
jgi:hypothetical protein